MAVLQLKSLSICLELGFLGEKLGLNRWKRKKENDVIENTVYFSSGAVKIFWRTCYFCLWIFDTLYETLTVQWEWQSRWKVNLAGSIEGTHLCLKNKHTHSRKKKEKVWYSLLTPFLSKIFIYKETIIIIWKKLRIQMLE